jgi:segregation and condensation protein A
MAAILAEIKSRFLLPKIVLEDEEEDPRAELIRRLQEYEVFKKAAVNLDELPRLERDVHLAKAELADNFKPSVIYPDVDLQELVLAFADIIKRAEAFEHHHIQREALSTRERMSQILSSLESHEFVEFSQLFTLEEGKAGVVVTFLAVLELVKESLIDCIQADVFGQIHVKRR